LRLALQVVYLVLVARILGVDGYGMFAGILALAAGLAPFAGLGFGLVLVKQVSRRVSAFPCYWGRTLAAILFSALPLVVGVMILESLLLPDADGSEWLVVSLVACSELVLVPVVSAASSVYQSHERLGRSMVTFVVLNLCRLVAAACLYVIPQEPSLELFAWMYFASTAIAVVVLFAVVTVEFGPPAWNFRGMWSEVKEAVQYSMSGVAGSMHGEIDKTLLLRLDGSVSAGTYSVATRVISAASTPLSAFVLSAVPSLFRAGEYGMNSGANLASRLLGPVLIYGLLAAGGIAIVSPFLPILLGAEFSATVPTIRWLVLLPLLLGVSSLLLGVLTCSGAQQYRVRIETVALSVNIVLNLILIPHFGTMGAVTSILVSQATLVAMVVFVVLRLAR
jgi:O-antigen/teichoic acid export membrane protein